MEEERIQVLNNMEEVEQKIKELDNQIEESAREVKKESRMLGTCFSEQSQTCTLIQGFFFLCKTCIFIYCNMKTFC